VGEIKVEWRVAVSKGPKEAPVKTSERPSKLHQHLHLYALAASAAGVSMLALAQPGEAEIVYTPVNQDILGTYDLDLTGDGTIDFYLIDFQQNVAGFSYGYLRVAASVTGNAVAKGEHGVRVLRSGDQIGPKTKLWESGGGVMESGYKEHTSPYRSKCFGPWKNKQGYLGVKFMISGEVHYGWALMSASCVLPHDRFGSMLIEGFLTGYAYETIPNKAIKAGQETGTMDESLNDEPTPQSVPAPTSATLGMLAKGAQALSIWRRE